MEAIAPQPPAFPPLGGQREGGGGGRDGGVERGVETGDGGHVGQHRGHRVQGGQRLGLVQRSQVGERTEPLPDAALDQHRAAELIAPVHDPVTDRAHLAERLDRRLDGRPVVPVPRRRQVGGAGDLVGVVKDAQLEAARPGVDDQDLSQYGHFQSLISGASSPRERV